VASGRADQRFDLAGEGAVVDGAIERAGAFALDDRGQVRRALTAALAYEHHVDAVPAWHVTMNALDALHSTGRVGVAQDQRRPLHRDAIDE
jgi:hypothetical protein